MRESNRLPGCPDCRAVGARIRLGQVLTRQQLLWHQVLLGRLWDAEARDAQYVRGKEYENNLVFATFESLEKCFEKHTELLTSGAPYRMVWARYLVSKDPEQLVRDMAPIYATDPHYADSVLAVMHMADVQAAIMPSLISI